MKPKHDFEKRQTFLLCNEAIARGAIEAGVQVATAYPGTPSSEIIDSLALLAQDSSMNVEYSTNEIVALEAAAGAAMCGIRSMTAMKHVGLNVASDALMTLAYTGVRGGMVVVTADDPNCYSSQNEQDNRYYALFANIPCLEPSNAQEAKEMLLYGFEISEKLELPILLRLVTRVAHSRGPVTQNSVLKKERVAFFDKDPKRFVPLPANARVQHRILIEKMQKAKQICEESPFNRARGNDKLGIVASGVSYNYAMEALRLMELDTSILKLGMIHPLPESQIVDFLRPRESAVVVEELEPFIESSLKTICYDHGLKVPIYGKSQGYFPRFGEYSVRTIIYGLSKIMNKLLPIDYAKIDALATSAEILAPSRPPVLCPGCSHAATLYAIKVATRGKGVYPTDIGCYTLGVDSPMKIGDALICMGSSVGISNGMSMVLEDPIVAVVGDSTFFHASIPGLINAVYNNHKFVYVVLDNLTTAMTGFQPHPGTGVKANGKPSKRVLIEEVAKGCGVKYVEVVDPYDLKQTIATIKRAVQHDGPSVVVARRICTSLSDLRHKPSPHRIISELCKFGSREVKGTHGTCMICLRSLGCPSIIVEDGKLAIDTSTCVGCGVCAQICPFNAIIKPEV